MARIRIQPECFEQSVETADSFTQAGGGSSGAEAFNSPGTEQDESISPRPAPGGGLMFKSVICLRQGLPPRGVDSLYYWDDPRPVTFPDGSHILYGKVVYTQTLRPSPAGLVWPVATSPQDSYAIIVKTIERSMFDGVDTVTWAHEGPVIVDGAGNVTFDLITPWDEGVVLFNYGIPKEYTDEVLAGPNPNEYHFRRTSIITYPFSAGALLYDFTYIQEFHFTVDRSPSLYMTNLLAAYSTLKSFSDPTFAEVHKTITDAGLADALSGYPPYLGTAAGFAGSWDGSYSAMSIQGAKYDVFARDWKERKVHYALEWTASPEVLTVQAPLIGGTWVKEPDGSYDDYSPVLTNP